MDRIVIVFSSTSLERMEESAPFVRRRISSPFGRAIKTDIRFLMASKLKEHRIAYFTMESFGIDTRTFK